MSNLETIKTIALFDSSLNKRLISELTAKGYNLILFPEINTQKVDLDEKEREVLSTITDFDWLIFTDVLTVDYFLDELRETGFDLFELDALTICALGESVSDRLRFAQLHADVVPPKIDPESVFSALNDYASGDLKGRKFLILKSRQTALDLIGDLNEAQAIVRELTVYEPVLTERADHVKKITLLKGGAVDEFVFTAVEDLIGFKLLFPSEQTAKVLIDIKISALSDNVYQALLEQNLRPLFFHQQ